MSPGHDASDTAREQLDRTLMALLYLLVRVGTQGGGPAQSEAIGQHLGWLAANPAASESMRNTARRLHLAWQGREAASGGPAPGSRGALH